MVKKFILVVVGMVAAGLALRYMLNRPAKPKPKAKPPTAVVREEPTPAVEQPKPAPEPTRPEREPEPEPPAPPRIAGTTQISDTDAQFFEPAPGVIYYCDGDSVMAAPKTGGPPKRIGDCSSALLAADAQGVHFCDGGRVMRISAGTEGSRVVAETSDCFVSALDAKYAYFVITGFEGSETPGVYRVARTGGTPERVHSTRPKEQHIVAVDNDAVWIGGWSAGTITKLAKTPGAKPRIVVTGQKGIVDLHVDAKSLYWYSESTGELRRRKKSGGPIETIAREITQEPIAVVDGHVYWFAGAAGEEKRLMHLAPGADAPEQLAGGLHAPSLRADAEGVYVSELDRSGIFMFKR